MNARDLQVTELTKDYVILSGERIDFDEPFNDFGGFWGILETWADATAFQNVGSCVLSFLNI